MITESAATGTESESASDNAFTVGTAVAAVFTLLPYASLLVLPAYVFGPLAAIWTLPAERRSSSSAKERAKLGFLSSLLGSGIATIIFDMVWQIFDYQIGQRQNNEFMLWLVHLFAPEATVNLFRDALDQASSQGFALYMIIAQALGLLVFAASIGSLSGVISGAILGKRRVSR